VTSRKPLSSEAIALHLKTLLTWSYRDAALHRSVELANYRQGLDWVSAIGELAEAHNHHPELTLHYGKLLIMLSTHDAQGVTEVDLNFARAVEKILEQ